MFEIFETFKPILVQICHGFGWGAKKGQKKNGFLVPWHILDN